MNHYYRTEWQIAQDPNDPRHVFPLPSDIRSLDLGCGCGSPPGLLGGDVFGLDVNVEPLLLGREWGASHRFAVGRGESIPFADNAFGRVFARVSLPYMDVRRTLREIARVLQPGGEVWLVLHPPRMVWQEFKRARWTSRVGRLFVLLNGMLLHLTGRQLHIAGRTETYQTRWGITRELRRAGFHHIRFDALRHVIVTAKLRAGPL